MHNRILHLCSILPIGLSILIDRGHSGSWSLMPEQQLVYRKCICTFAPTLNKLLVAKLIETTDDCHISA